MIDADTPWTDAESRDLHARLLASGRRVAVAESLTVGHVQSALGRPGGASAYFVGGITTYALAAKLRLLGVNATHATTVNAISERVAIEMARGVIRLFDCELGLATTGYAEPDPSRGAPAPYAWVAAVHGPRVLTTCIGGGGLSRIEMQTQTAAAALRLLVELLAEETSPTKPTA
ncbi:MAG: CinA family protein [Verrucomicrobia bacterium]|nr:CinA family protein [Verrucomicrobiota bacterium]